MSKQTDIRLLTDGLVFPEGPRWRSEGLWFSDIRAQTVNVITMDGEVRAVLQLDDGPSGLGFLPDGTPLVVSMRQRLLLRLVDGRTERHADLRGVPGDFLNDMLVDDLGRAYVGSRSRSLHASPKPLGEESAIDAITIVEPDGRVRLGATDAISPNGTVLTPDERTLIVAETYAQRIVTYDRSPSGDLTNKRVFANLPGRYPDGICLDEDGAIWVGSPYTDEFVRVRPGGAITDRIAMVGGVACALGGTDGKALFLLAVDPALLGAFDSDGAEESALPRPVQSMPGRLGVIDVQFASAGRQ